MKKTNGSTKLVLGTVIAAGLAAGSMGASALVAPVEGTIPRHVIASMLQSGELRASETLMRALSPADVSGYQVFKTEEGNKCAVYNEADSNNPVATVPFNSPFHIANEPSQFIVVLGENDTPILQVYNPPAPVVTWLSIRPKVTLDDWTYGEEPNEPVIENNPSKGKVTITYKPADADDEEYTEEVPTEAGDYIVRVEVASSYPYLKGTAKDEFTIWQANPIIGWVSIGLPFNTLNPADLTFEREHLDVPGTLGLFNPEEVTLDWGANTVDWIFTPDDARNYQAVTGEATVRAARDGWVELPGGVWNYYDAGAKITGWLEDSDYDGRFYFDEDGTMVTGWQVIDGKRYFFGPGGKMRTGWTQVAGDWYYLDPETGVMQTGWLYSDEYGARYYLREDGAMATWWQCIGNDWYFFGTSGRLHTGWVLTGGAWYWMDPQTGIMHIGWLRDGGAWYYLQEHGVPLGALLRNGVTPDGYRVGPDGAWTR